MSEEINEEDTAELDLENQEELEDIEDAEETENELSEAETQARIAQLKPIIEGALLAAGEALKLTRLQSLFDEHDMPSKGLLVETLRVLQADHVDRGFELVEVASGWRFQVKEGYASWVNRLWEEKPQKYSRALLETLALIAYRQPLTRGDIEEVRGVAVSSHIIKTLAEREWVKVVGHRDVPGRPALYATTRQFLDYFSLKSLDELPTLGELKDIDSLNAPLELIDPPASETPDAETLSEEQEVASGEHANDADGLSSENTGSSLLDVAEKADESDQESDLSDEP